jgi:hypothetical protein
MYISTLPHSLDLTGAIGGAKTVPPKRERQREHTKAVENSSAMAMTCIVHAVQCTSSVFKAAAAIS